MVDYAEICTLTIHRGLFQTGKSSHLLNILQKNTKLEVNLSVFFLVNVYQNTVKRRNLDGICWFLISNGELKE